MKKKAFCGLLFLFICFVFISCTKYKIVEQEQIDILNSKITSLENEIELFKNNSTPQNNETSMSKELKRKRLTKIVYNKDTDGKDVGIQIEETYKLNIHFNNDKLFYTIDRTNKYVSVINITKFYLTDSIGTILVEINIKNWVKTGSFLENPELNLSYGSIPISYEIFKNIQDWRIYEN